MSSRFSLCLTPKHTKIHTETHRNETAHIQQLTIAGRNQHTTHSDTHTELLDCVFCCGNLLSICTKQFLICTHSAIITHAHISNLRALDWSRHLYVCVYMCVRVYMCAHVCRGQGVKGGVVMATQLRLPSQFYLSVQHSSLSVCLPPCLSVCMLLLPVCLRVCVSVCGCLELVLTRQ